MSTACLLFSCNDQPGIVAAISNFLFEKNLNIIALEQHSENNIFFTRIEWEDSGIWSTENLFKKEFKIISKKFDGQISVHFFSKIQTCGLFVSKEPHALLEILAKIEMQEFENIKIPFVIANHENCKKIVERYNIPFFYIPTKKNSLNHEKEQLKIIKKFSPNFIGLARYMKILSKNFIDKSDCPIINIHHSFLPSFVGANPYEMAYERGVKLIGATSHFVIPKLDQGPIIEQDVTRIGSGYAVDKIKKIGKDIEKTVFSHALKKVFEHKVIVHKNRTIVFK